MKKFEIVVIIVLVFSLAIAISFLQSGGKKCLSNPFYYGALEIKDANNGEQVNCQCDLMSKDIKKIIFSSESDKIDYQIGPSIEFSP